MPEEEQYDPLTVEQLLDGFEYCGTTDSMKTSSSSSVSGDIWKPKVEKEEVREWREKIQRHRAEIKVKREAKAKVREQIYKDEGWTLDGIFPLEDQLFLTERLRYILRTPSSRPEEPVTSVIDHAEKIMHILEDYKETDERIEELFRHPNDVDYVRLANKSDREWRARNSMPKREGKKKEPEEKSK